MEYLTKSSAAQRSASIGATESPLLWQDAVDTVTNLENENDVLREKNAELTKRVNLAQAKMKTALPADPQTIKMMERHCRDLEDYITELEEKKTQWVDERLFREERDKVHDLQVKVKRLDDHSATLARDKINLERDNAELRNQNMALSRELADTKDMLAKSERMLADTKEKWEVAENDRDKLRRDLKEVEDREVKHLEIQKNLQHRVDTTQKELDAVYKWYGERKCHCLKKKGAPEPWKKYM